MFSSLAAYATTSDCVAGRSSAQLYISPGFLFCMEENRILDTSLTWIREKR